jgi:hypothetical protein
VIPAILAVPAVEGLLGSVAGVASSILSAPFSQGGPSSATPAASGFGPILSQVSSRASALLYATPTGSMTTNDWNGMSGTDVHNWMMSLTGKHVHAVETDGKTISGIVQGYSTMNGTTGLNISGHFVSLSNLNQVSWSPAIR